MFLSFWSGKVATLKLYRLKIKVNKEISHFNLILTKQKNAQNYAEFVRLCHLCHDAACSITRPTAWGRSSARRRWTSLGPTSRRHSASRTTSTRPPAPGTQFNWETILLEKSDCFYTGRPAYNDTVGTRQKCLSNQIVTLSRGSLFKNTSFGKCHHCHFSRSVTLTSVIVSERPCSDKYSITGYLRLVTGSEWNLKVFFQPEHKPHIFLLNCHPGSPSPRSPAGPAPRISSIAPSSRTGSPPQTSGKIFYSSSFIQVDS